jgi:ABC-type sugar transport system ATPase subunit
MADGVNAAETRGLTKIIRAGRSCKAWILKSAPAPFTRCLGPTAAAKSTVVKLLTGVYQPDGGVITIGGREMASIASPRAASALGVAVVHQEAPFIDTLSVAECTAQFRGYPTHGGRIQWAKLNREVRAMLEPFDGRFCGRRSSLASRSAAP